MIEWRLLMKTEGLNCVDFMHFGTDFGAVQCTKDETFIMFYFDPETNRITQQSNNYFQSDQVVSTFAEG